jgi:DNA mismatch repair protein MutL
VIVRPASAIKEMVENSLDAGARRVSVEVTNSCRDLIVTDDGCGMTPDDAATALQRHATSKIATLDDLQRVATRGFRGEALPSMASVSRMTILTRTADQLEGTFLQLEGGEQQEQEPRAAPVGTRIEIRDLFYNVPARRKFLKSARSELNAILSMMTQLALSRPDVVFEVHSDGRARLQTRGPVSLRERIGQVLGQNLAQGMLQVEAGGHNPRFDLLKGEPLPEKEEATASDDPTLAAPATLGLYGYITLPEQAARSRTHQYLFANGRPIIHRRLPAVLQEAYRGLLMVRRFPPAVMFFEVPTSEIDVNVHPTKEEVRFAQEDALCSLIYRGAQAALARADLVPGVQLGAKHASTESSPQKADSPDAVTSASGETPSVASDSDASSEGAPATSQDEAARLAEWQLRELRSIYHDAGEDDLSALRRRSSDQPDFLGASGRVDNPQRQTATDSDIIDHDAKTPIPTPAKPRSAEVRPDEQPGGDDAPGDRFTAPDPSQLGRTLPHLEVAREAETPFFQGPPPRPLGQIGLKYILAESGDDILLIDQHAAHERLLYHQFTSRVTTTEVQELLIPVAVDLPAAHAATMDDLLPLLNDLGLRVEPFGGNTFVVQSTPADLPHLDVARVVTDLAADFADDRQSEALSEARDKLLTRFSCRAAIKAGQSLSHDEMKALLHSMRDAQLPFTCPHGRPTMLRLTADQLDQQFGRLG